MTIVTLVSGCGYAYPGDGTRDGGGQLAMREIDSALKRSASEGSELDAPSGGSADVDPRVDPEPFKAPNH
jgi:hypothetical protein